jgi:prevent-host-death family protein
MSAIVNMHAAKTQLSRLVDRALAGEEVVIARDGVPQVKLVPVEPRRPLRIPGRFANQGYWIAPDFDETPEWLIDDFEGNLKED